jgi:hypothetical protein
MVLHAFPAYGLLAELAKQNKRLLAMLQAHAHSPSSGTGLSRFSPIHCSQWIANSIDQILD